MFLIPANVKPPRFPPVEQASREGLLAIGGDLSSDRLLEAYRRGIFPWYSEGQPILWWSPDPRAILYLDQLKVSRSLNKRLRRDEFQVTFDTCFTEVIHACAQPRMPTDNGGTWITSEMTKAYLQLHRLGYAHSVETWRGGTLVGGLYGLALGRGFFGESMFNRVTDASKIALVKLVELLRHKDFAFVDCQLPSSHLMRLGAQTVSRRFFLRELHKALKYRDQPESWTKAAVAANVSTAP